MKISTLALSALISFSASTFAQSKSAQKDSTAKANTATYHKHKSTTKTKGDTSNSQTNKPKRHSARYCPGCGMG